MGNSRKWRVATRVLGAIALSIGALAQPEAQSQAAPGAEKVVVPDLGEATAPLERRVAHAPGQVPGLAFTHRHRDVGERHRCGPQGLDFHRLEEPQQRQLALRLDERVGIEGIAGCQR